MKEYLDEFEKKFKIVFHGYGKVILATFLFIVGSIFIFLIIYLITPHKLRVSFLDVGQGDAILVQTPSGKSMLVDGGGTNIILTRLAHEMSYFNHDIDVMVATHPDADHVTGLIPVLEKYNVHTVIMSTSLGHTKVFDSLNSYINSEQAEVRTAHTGDEIDFHDGVIVNILHPKLNYVSNKIDTNDASVCLLISYGDETFLLTGDLPSTREQQLIDSNLLKFTKNITVYKAGHHGSKTSSGEHLLSYIHPEYTVISAGKDNKYGHPNTETVERLQKYTKEIISTAGRGTVSFMTDGRMFEVKTKK